MPRHNKKRNTALLYEMLVREIIKQTVNKNIINRNKAIVILKEHFKKDTEMGKELQLFKNLLETKELLPHSAEKLIQETKKEYKALNVKKVFKEQSTLIKKINQELSKEVFSNFVPSYKDIATLSQMFGADINVKRRVLLEESVLRRITQNAPPSKEKNTNLSGLVVKKFIEKFNHKYNDTLLENQKTLLNKFILSFLDNGTDFKVYLNEEIESLKNEITDAFGMEELKQDTEMTSRMKEIKNHELLEKVLKIQVLAKEIKS